jgi:heme A synthase
VPRPESIETMIEFSHRLTSGLAGIFILVLFAWAWLLRRRGEANRWVWWGAFMSLVFVIIEGGIGAGLVLLELTADNTSVWRAVMIAIHLLNTYVLLYWLTLTAWASHAQNTTFRRSRVGRLLVVALIGMAILSAAGAVTALGDTLLLDGSLEAQFGAEATNHFLVQLRVIHPLLAIVVSAYLLVIGWTLTKGEMPPIIRRLAYTVMGLVALQVIVGIVTIILRAPIVLQMSHLLLADALWIALLLLTFEAMTSLRDVPEQSLQPAQA